LFEVVAQLPHVDRVGPVGDGERGLQPFEGEVVNPDSPRLVVSSPLVRRLSASFSVMVTSLWELAEISR